MSLVFQFPVGMSNKSYLAFYGSAVATKKSFNSPWECRISLTLKDASRQKASKLIFQFPVGISNKSYEVGPNGEIQLGYLFQFPVGMSNKSYFISRKVNCRTIFIPFNSPWECRISLTPFRRNALGMMLRIFQFPVGMSNRSYMDGCYAHA